MKTKFFTPFLLLVCLCVIFGFSFPPAPLLADGADITFGTEEEITDDTVKLQLGGTLPTAISRFEMDINYNSEAFYLRGSNSDGVRGGTINVQETSSGVLHVTGSGNFPAGDQLLLTLELEAKAPGVASVVLIRSRFYNSAGTTIPGTLLRYYTLNMQDSVIVPTSPPPTQGGTNPDGTSPIVTGPGTIFTIGPSQSLDPTVSSENTETSISTTVAETTVPTTEPVEETTATVSETTALTETTSEETTPAILPTEPAERSGAPDLIVSAVLGVGILGLIIAIIVILRRNHKRR